MFRGIASTLGMPAFNKFMHSFLYYVLLVFANWSQLGCLCKKIVASVAC